MKTRFSNQNFQHDWSDEIKTDPPTTPVNLSEIWAAAELLISPELLARKKGFQSLVELDEIKQNPVIVYLLASRLTEPDLSLRSFIVKILADMLDGSQPILDQSKKSRNILADYLSRISVKELTSLLELAEVDPHSMDFVVHLLCSCACAEDQITRIVMDRDQPAEIRLISLEIIGKVGYLEAIPDLERLEKRMKNRVNAENYNSTESELLRKLDTTIQLLRSS